MRPTKKWLAPGTTSVRVWSNLRPRRCTDDGSRNSSCSASTRSLGARIVRDRREVGAEAQRRRDREPCRDAHRRRSRAPCRRRTTSPARTAASSAPEAARSAEERDRGERVEVLVAPVVRASPLAALDAAEVEAQARDAGRGSASKSAPITIDAHGAAVLRVRVAQHHRRASVGPSAASRLRFEHEAVAGRDRPCARSVAQFSGSPSWSICSTNASTSASSRHAS